MKALKKLVREILISLGLNSILARYFSKKYYSQDGEDVILRSFYEYQKDKGFYIDIGAYHPFGLSNTQLFYEIGWRGINIDARPDSMKLFRKVRKRDVNLEMGVSDKEGELEYFSFECANINSFDKRTSEEWINNGYKLKEIQKIKVFPINSILEKYVPEGQKISFISMDVEGFEERIIKSLDFKKFAPEYFLIEELDYVENDFMEYRTSLIYNLLKDKGYIVIAKTKRTVIFKQIILS